ncbi:MAG: TolC family protein [Bryobacteraceae bacterium]|nr:TolC family protein [Bryobacteraceae bacterium]
MTLARMFAGLFLPVLASGQVLRLEDVLESVQRHYPPLLATLQDQAVANAETLQAEGRFDIVVRGRWDSDSLGFYTNRRWDFSFEQPTTMQGLSFLGGYRLGEGSYAPYDGKLDTRSAGEVRTGLRLPLLRDRATDSRRGDLAKARIGQNIARLGIDQQKLFVNLLATRAYWDWVAAGRRFTLAQAVRQIAQNRQTFLDESVKGGLIPAIDAADNRRAVLQRQGQVIEAERLLQQAAITLSLYYRDDKGGTQLPAADRLPDAFPAAQDLPRTQVAEDAARALQRRPEIPRLQAQLEQNVVDVQQARNQQLPALDVIAGFTSESGTGLVRRGPQELKAGVNVELPWQRRTATGRLRASEARIVQIRQREQFAKDQVIAEVQDAASAVQTAHQRLGAVRDEVGVSRQLEDAERTRFELGEGTLFQLNLRELATVESMQREINAEADYHRAMGAYSAAIGVIP